MKDVEGRRIEIQRRRQVLVAIRAVPMRIRRQVTSSPLAKRFADLGGDEKLRFRGESTDVAHAVGCHQVENTAFTAVTTR